MSERVYQEKYILIYTYTHQLIHSICSTIVENSLQINLFLQNKANFKNSQMFVSLANTRDYQNFRPSGRDKNKANSKPIKANSKNGQNECKLFYDK